MKRALTVFVLIACIAPLTTAHDWQTTVTADDFELGMNTDPATPVAGENVSFVAAIDHDNASLPDQQTMQGSVVNAEALITITAPSGTTTTQQATIPDDDPHFHFAHRFTESGDHTVQVRLAEQHRGNNTADHDDNDQPAYHEITTFDVSVPVGEPNIAVKTSIAAEAVEQVKDDTAKTRSAVDDQQDTLRSLQTTVNDQGATLTRLKEKLEEQNSMIAFQRWTILASLLIILSVFIRDLTQE